MKGGRREATIKQRKEFLRTRIFNTEGIRYRTRIEGDDHNIQSLEEKKIFSKDGTEFLCNPPNQCIDDPTVFAQKKNSTTCYNLEQWITVYCVVPSQRNSIVKYFNQFGEISSFRCPTNNDGCLNYISIEFVNKSTAKLITDFSQPILISPTTAVFCELGIYHQSTQEVSQYQHFEDPTISNDPHIDLTFPGLIRGIQNFFRWFFF